MQDLHHDYEFYPGSGKTDHLTDNIYNQPLQPLWETEQYLRFHVLRVVIAVTTEKAVVFCSATSYRCVCCLCFAASAPI